MKKSDRSESFLVKIFIALFFVLGVGLWISLDAPDERKKEEIDLTLNQRLTDTLFNAKVRQEDILKQYAKDTGDKTATWTQYYKTVKVSSQSKINELEKSFRQLAKEMNLGLEKVIKVDNTVEYNFIAKGNRLYSQVDFVIEKPAPAPPKKTKAPARKRK
jgi:hypothetical protein